MPGVIAPFNWNYPLIGEGANGPDGFKMLGEGIAATITDTTIQSYTPTWTADGQQPGALGAVQGRYRVDNGVCEFSVYFGFGAGTSGGTLALHVGLPKAARADVQSQIVQCWMHAAPAGQFVQGFASIVASAIRADPFFPTIATQSNMGQWSNANSTGATGTGTPTFPGVWGIGNGGWFVMSGRYFCVP